MDLQILYNNPSHKKKKSKSHKGGAMAKKRTKKASAKKYHSSGKKQHQFKKKRNPKMYYERTGVVKPRLNIFGEEVTRNVKKKLPKFVEGKVNFLENDQIQKRTEKFEKAIAKIQSGDRVATNKKEAEKIIKVFENLRDKFEKKIKKTAEDLEREEARMAEIGYTRTGVKKAQAKEANRKEQEENRKEKAELNKFNREIDQMIHFLGKATGTKKKKKAKKKSAKRRSSKPRRKNNPSIEVLDNPRKKKKARKKAGKRKSAGRKKAGRKSRKYISKLKNRPYLGESFVPAGESSDKYGMFKKKKKSGGESAKKAGRPKKKNNPSSKIQVLDNPKKKKKKSKKVKSKKGKSKVKKSKAKTKAVSTRKKYKKARYKVKSNPGANMASKFEQITKHEVMEATGLASGGVLLKIYNQHAKQAVVNLPGIKNLYQMIPAKAAPLFDGLVDVLLAAGLGHIISKASKGNAKAEAISKGIIGAAVVSFSMKATQSAYALAGQQMNGFVAVPSMDGIIAVPEMEGIIAVPEMNGFGEADFGQFDSDADFGAILATPEMEGMGEADFGEYEYEDEGADF